MVHVSVIWFVVLYIAWIVGEQAGGVHRVLAHAQAAGRMQFLPEPKLIDSDLVKSHLQSDPQRILPQLVLAHTPPLAQIMFFGALLSAIMSTASGTLLAPSVTFTENVLKRFLRKDLSDRQMLCTMRAVVPLVAGLYWKRANSQGALLSIVFGMATWIAMEALAPGALSRHPRG
ncbi:MAG: sodium:solute symporter family transporter [Burkholderiales bacterium]